MYFVSPSLLLLLLFPLIRGYNQDKITNNVQCEIFQTILEEARESYSPDIVSELTSNVPEDMERNVDLICQFIADWQKNKQ